MRLLLLAVTIALLVGCGSPPEPTAAERAAYEPKLELPAKVRDRKASLPR